MKNGKRNYCFGHSYYSYVVSKLFKVSSKVSYIIFKLN